MAEVQNSRVAELLFSQAPVCDFTRTIAELDSILSRIYQGRCKLNWDCDDVASFDMPGTRILLSFGDSPYPGFACRLVVSVGPSGLAVLQDQSLIVHAALCSRIVTRMQARCVAAELRWHDVKGVVTADEVDRLAQQARPPRPRTSIFNHQPVGQMTELQVLRRAMHRYSLHGGLPAVAHRLAQNTAGLAAGLASLPQSAAQYAADLYRSALHNA
ncbi:MAG: Uncharacterized protein FD162_1286 [Rhodobacteraceae bacterium]|uniref:hypothetical protein n=1 Tax=Cypionkella sp. TaxID=2811411 RepID=UPI001320D903|nr:hypothetical protein [Cypionkella sp.]KAF0174051.1 MAG: Uncharacterized protein FD162_1286 [Paracoccaceae bacterium]MDO8326915.1 hypothetical protein [Cypionkella sp.]